MADSEPTKIVGVVAEEVTAPRNDGTRGSALYAVPFKLSRPVSSAWASLFEQAWDHPPSYTSMHRPGICRVYGDRIVLDGTTLDEVDRVHKETLKLVLERVNSQIEQLEHQARLQADQQQQRLKAHADEVKDKASRIRFDD